jgi:hypothetical protein
MKNGRYDLALSQYQNIITHHDVIYSDEALFFLQRYNNKLQDPENWNTLSKLERSSGKYEVTQTFKYNQ